MVKRYLPYLEASLGFHVPHEELVPVYAPEAEVVSRRFMFRRGEAQYILRVPAAQDQDAGFLPARALAEALEHVRGRLAGSPLSGTIPRVAVIAGGEMAPALVESALPGTQASRWIGFGWRLSRRRTRKVTEMALDWLMAFQRATIVDRVPVAEMLRTTRSGLDLDALFEAKPALLPPAAMDALGRTVNALAAERERTVPLCASHGAFSPANVLIQDGAICGVIQWDAFRPEEHPFADLWHFLVSTATTGSLAAGTLAGHLTRHLLGTGWYATLVQGAVGRAAATHGVPEYLIRTFLVLHLARLVLRHREGGLGPVWAGLLRRILLFESTGDGLVR